MPSHGYMNFGVVTPYFETTTGTKHVSLSHVTNDFEESRRVRKVSDGRIRLRKTLGKPTTDAALRLDVRWLARQGLIAPGITAEMPCAGGATASQTAASSCAMTRNGRISCSWSSHAGDRRAGLDHRPRHPPVGVDPLPLRGPTPLVSLSGVWQPASGPLRVCMAGFAASPVTAWPTAVPARIGSPASTGGANASPIASGPSRHGS